MTVRDRDWSWDMFSKLIRTLFLAICQCHDVGIDLKTLPSIIFVVYPWKQVMKKYTYVYELRRDVITCHENPFRVSCHSWSESIDSPPMAFSVSLNKLLNKQWKRRLSETRWFYGDAFMWRYYKISGGKHLIPVLRIVTALYVIMSNVGKCKMSTSYRLFTPYI